MAFGDWRTYVPVAMRRRRAAREMAALAGKGHQAAPVIVHGRAIAGTFWGKAWCANLERYSDFANRLPRGRTYVRNGSVVDLHVGSGTVSAFVSGSELYAVEVKVATLTKARWSAVCRDSAGAIDSLVELLQGRFSERVMERLCREGTGLFPSPAEIAFTCSCPDWASMCKHVAAALYGIGARLDQQPELLFTLRRVDGQDLVARAGKGLPLGGQEPAAGKRLVAGDLSEIFGIEIAESSRARRDRQATAMASDGGRPAAGPSTSAKSSKRSGASSKSSRPSKPSKLSKSSKSSEPSKSSKAGASTRRPKGSKPGQRSSQAVRSRKPRRTDQG